LRRRRKLYIWLIIGGIALGLTTLNGCGTIQRPVSSTPFASTIMVTATTGTIQRTAPLTVTVQ
jgi:hypothetical protein